MYIYIIVTPADQMSDKSGFDICRECRLKPVGMILINLSFYINKIKIKHPF